jgi:hypothetical protein
MATRNRPGRLVGDDTSKCVETKAEAALLVAVPPASHRLDDSIGDRQIQILASASAAHKWSSFSRA